MVINKIWNCKTWLHSKLGAVRLPWAEQVKQTWWNPWFNHSEALTVTFANEPRIFIYKYTCLVNFKPSLIDLNIIGPYLSNRSLTCVSKHTHWFFFFFFFFSNFFRICKIVFGWNSKFMPLPKVGSLLLCGLLCTKCPKQQCIHSWHWNQMQSSKLRCSCKQSKCLVFWLHALCNIGLHWWKLHLIRLVVSSGMEN